MTELVEEGEFDDMVPQAAKALPPKEAFARILTQHKVALLLDNPEWEKD